MNCQQNGKKDSVRGAWRTFRYRRGSILAKVEVRPMERASGQEQPGDLLVTERTISSNPVS